MLVRGTKDKEHAMAEALKNSIAFVGIDIGKNLWSGAKQLQSETGYIDARPLTPARRKPLATHGRT